MNDFSFIHQLLNNLPNINFKDHPTQQEKLKFGNGSSKIQKDPQKKTSHNQNESIEIIKLKFDTDRIVNYVIKPKQKERSKIVPSVPIQDVRPTQIVLGQVNSFKISNKKIVNSLDYIKDAQISNAEKILTNQTACKCKKSKCLKMYCDCFAAQQICSPECNCIDCMNTQYILPSTKVSIQKLGVEMKGCRCGKTGCINKYCECYKLEQQCQPWCQCSGCKNNTWKKLKKLKTI